MSRVGRGWGVFIFVVGPSGAGKDTLIAAARAELARDDRFHFVRRMVTRPSGEWEDHQSLGPEAFADAASSGAFALTWEAHGLQYGVPVAVLDHVRQGRVVVCNGSRGAIGAAMQAFDRLRIVLVTAPREIRLARLAHRGREEDTSARLNRLDSGEFSQIADLVIINDSTPEVGASKLLTFLEQEARRC